MVVKDRNVRAVLPVEPRTDGSHVFPRRVRAPRRPGDPQRRRLGPRVLQWPRCAALQGAGTRSRQRLAELHRTAAPAKLPGDFTYPPRHTWLDLAGEPP